MSSFENAELPPKGATHVIANEFYKIGVHGKIFVWRCLEWKLSPKVFKDNELPKTLSLEFLAENATWRKQIPHIRTMLETMSLQQVSEAYAITPRKMRHICKKNDFIIPNDRYRNQRRA